MFQEIKIDEMMMVDGGCWSSNCVGGMLTVVAGGCCVVGGAVLLGTPEPTGLTKVGGYAAMVGGVATMGAGIATIKNYH